MLPPETTMPTCLPRNRSGCARSAATPTAPAPSATMLGTLDHEAHRLFDRGLVDEEDVGDQLRRRSRG